MVVVVVVVVVVVLVVVVVQKNLLESRERMKRNPKVGKKTFPACW